MYYERQYEPVKDLLLFRDRECLRSLSPGRVDAGDQCARYLQLFTPQRLAPPVFVPEPSLRISRTTKDNDLLRQCRGHCETAAYGDDEHREE